MKADTRSVPDGSGSGQNVDQALGVMSEAIRRAKIPAMSVAVSGSDGILFAGAAGHAELSEPRLASVEDQYPWFSMTKIATATAVMRLHAYGVLDLDAPIGEMLPDYRPHPRHGHPTTRHLLTHTAGLTNPVPIRWVRAEGLDEDPAARQRLLARYGTPRRRVGERAADSNIGYLLAGEVIAAVSGSTVEDCVQATVLDPLGMSSTGYRYAAAWPRAVGYVRMPGVLTPALRTLLPAGLVGPRTDGYTALRPFLVNGAAYGGLVGGVTDAVKLAAAHLPTRPGTSPLLSHDDLVRMQRITATGKRFDHGIGWFRRPRDATAEPRFVEHYGTGGGFWNAMRIYPTVGLAMTAMTNTTSAWDVHSLFDQLRSLSWN